MQNLSKEFKIVIMMLSQDTFSGRIILTTFMHFNMVMSNQKKKTISQKRITGESDHYENETQNTREVKQFLCMQCLQCVHYYRVEITDLVYAH